MFRLLALLQLTRAALAFTAIADAWFRMPALLYAGGPENSPVSHYGKYGFWICGAQNALDERSFHRALWVWHES